MFSLCNILLCNLTLDNSSLKFINFLLNSSRLLNLILFFKFSQKSIRLSKLFFSFSNETNFFFKKINFWVDSFLSSFNIETNFFISSKGFILLFLLTMVPSKMPFSKFSILSIIFIFSIISLCNASFTCCKFSCNNLLSFSKMKLSSFKVPKSLINSP